MKEAGASSYASLITGIDYSPLEKIASLGYANGVTTTNTYDPKKLYRLTRKVTLLPVSSGASRLAQDLSYSYDNVGNILKIVDASETDTRKTSTFTYDDLYRVLTASVISANNRLLYKETYSYDPIGNISSKAGTSYNWSYAYGNLKGGYANPHAVTTIRQQRLIQTLYSYDGNGNLISINGDAALTWDHNNRLSQIVDSDLPISYAYDQVGQRIKAANSSTTTIYPSRFYNVSRATDLQSVKGSKRPSGTPSSAFATASIKHIFVGGELVATVTGSGLGAVVHSVHTDHLTGSNVISNMSGQIEELTDYYPYGALRLDESLSGFSEQRKFAGHEYDVDTGLSYMDARYYNGSIGRFISQDPAFRSIHTGLADPQVINSYSYARNNPLAYIDPNGHRPTLTQALAIADRYNPLNILFQQDTEHLSHALITGNGKEAAKAGGNIALTTGAVIITAWDIAYIAADAATTYRAYNRYQQYQQELQDIDERTAARRVNNLISRIDAHESYEKHVLGINNKYGREYGSLFRNEDEWNDYVRGVISNPSASFSGPDKDLYWDDRLGTIVIDNKTGGSPTAFQARIGKQEYLKEVDKQKALIKK